ncbi:hypothetical protein KKI24_24385 [bacterium]|nr:hypothetical protein [bacterium]
MSDFWDKLIKDAGEKSIEEFCDKASSEIKLTNSEIELMIPQEVDKKKFAELMRVVKSTALNNTEKAKQIREVTGFAEIAVNLIEKLA